MIAEAALPVCLGGIESSYSVQCLKNSDGAITGFLFMQIFFCRFD